MIGQVAKLGKTSVRAKKKKITEGSVWQTGTISLHE